MGKKMQTAEPPTRSEELLRALNAAAAAVLRERGVRSPEAVFEAVGRELDRLGIRTTISLLDETRQHLIVRHVTLRPKAQAIIRKMMGGELVGYTFPVEQIAACQQVVETGQTIFDENPAQNIMQILPEPWRTLAAPMVPAMRHVRSIMAPLTITGERIGTLSVASANLTPADVPAITAFADLVSAMLETARSYEELARHEQETVVVNAIVQALNACRNVRDVFGAVARELGKLVPFDRASIALPSADRQSFTMYALIDQPGAPLGEGVTMPVAATAAGSDVLAGRLHLTPDLSAETDYPGERLLYQAGLRSRVNVPLRVGDQVLGSLNLASTRPAAFTAQHLDLLQQVAGAIAAALQNAQLYEQVQVSEARYRHLVENVHDLIYEVDAEGVITYCSPSLEFLSGYTMAEVLGRSFLELVHPDDLPTVVEHVRRRLSGILEPAEFRLRDRDGRYRWVRSLSRPVVRDGQVLGLTGVATDITARKEAELALYRRDDILSAVSFAATRLLEPGDFADGVNAALAGLGVAADVSRIYVFQNHTAPDGALLASQRYEWVAPGITPQMDNPDLQNFPYLAGGFARWVELLGRDEVICGPVRDLPAPERAVLEPQDIRSILIVPIFVVGNWWGFIGFDDCVSERDWSATEIGALRTAAGILGAALQRQDMEAELRHHNEQLNALLVSARHVTSTLDLDEVLQRVVESALTAIGPAEKGSVHLWDEECGELVMRASVGFSPQTVAAVRLKPGEGYAGWVFAQRQPLILGDVQSDPHLKPIALSEVEELKSALCVPLVVRDRTIGTLSLDNLTQYHAFTPEHRDLLTIFASQVAGAIENARLFASLAQEKARLETLYRLSHHLAESLELHQVAQQTLDETCAVVGATRGVVLVLEPDGEHVRMAAVSGYQAESVQALNERLHLHLGDGLAGWVMAQRQAALVDDVTQDARWLLVSGLDDWVRSALSVPLLSGDKLVGALSLYSDQVAFFQPEHRQLAESVAAVVAVAVENARLFQETHRRAIELGTLYDVVTAAATSVHLDEVLHRSVAALRQALRPDNVTLLLVEPGTGNLIIRAGVNAAGEVFLTHQPVPRSATALVTWVADTGQPVLLADVHEDNRYYPCDPASRSELCVPLCVRSRTIGVLNLESHRPGAFTGADLHLVSTLAGHLATVIDNARLVQTLRESETRYRALFEQANDAVFLETLEGRILDANAKAGELLGYSREELLTLTVADLVPPEIRAQLPQVIERQLRNGGMRLEAENVHKDGTRIPVEVSTSLLTINGQRLVLVLVRDIRERKRLEEQLRQAQKMEAIGTLAGGIAHDFNNLLGAILGFASLMERDLPADSPLRTPVQTIITAARRGADLTNQLLAFARGGRYEVRPISLNEAAREVVRLLSRTVDKTIAIEPRLADDLATVEGDAGQLHQMLLNLCLNAVDAMPGGGQLIIETENVTLSQEQAQAEPELQPGPHVRLRVIDTGTGMDPETMRRIFEPFFTTKKGQPGRPHSGLGLAMVYGIVRSHSGAIRVYSEVGRGSTFEVYLPALARPAPLPPIPAAAPTGGAETVLVVDDEDFIRYLLQRALEDAGYTVLLAEDGPQALELYRARGPEIDLVILDMGLPQVSGRQVFHHLRQLDPNAVVLISSGYAEDDQARAMIEAGARGFLAKPYDLNELLSKVRQVLDRP